ncbi:MAG: DUF2264 domain-containing protein [Streptococcaceae bacterium]|jgi:hypothetical protein|nr:DUF2264 domain-containing protein [Streptococcaceae bacterium]
MLSDYKRNWKYQSYDDIKGALEVLMNSVKPFYTERKGHIKLGTSGTVYSEDTQQAEGYLRMLWALGPLWSQNEAPDLQKIYLEGIAAATDPENADYWGDVTDYDQLLVEMASLSLTLMIAKDKIWNQLSAKEQENLAAWLRQINDQAMPANNWHFFRVLVNICLMKLGCEYSQEKLKEDLSLIDSHYEGNGWYRDGEKTQFDYYIPWAYHFYGLIYAKLMENEDPERSALFKKRATDFAQSFYHMFDADGDAVPFGRSLTYRFAQASFWGALVFADVEALPWGVIKGLYSRNMAQWFKRDIFSTDGLLTIGYYYQNMIFAEGYNSPGSPYWAFKSFILLAVPKDHPYWQAEVLDFPKNETRVLNLEGHAFYEHVDDFHHTLMYPFGQRVNNQNNSEAKYSKFVYSSKFGMSAQKASYNYYEAALDNVLSVSCDEHYYRPKAEDLSYQATDEWIKYDWEPIPGTHILSTIVPYGAYHVRIHEINTQQPINVHEGGFSIPMEGCRKAENDQSASCTTSLGTSIVTNVTGFDRAEVIRTEPNTNLLYPRTYLPTLGAKLSQGNHLLVSVVGGLTSAEEQPKVTVTEDQIIIEGKRRVLVKRDQFPERNEQK